jgi:CRP/FNR family transcriptional regulator, anaerobic regulatory protein
MSDSARFALHRPELHSSLLSGEQKIVALMSGSARSLRSGEELIAAGTEHPFVYRLLEGWASRVRQIGDGRDQGILMFLPGDLFAVKSMFVTRHPDAVRALSPGVVEVVHYKDLHAAYMEDADIANRCIWQVIEEERRLHNWVVSLGQGSAEERVAMLLVDFHGRLARSGTIAPDALEFAMPLTQIQLADHLGLTAVHVNRTLRGFRENGILTVRDGHVAIHDLNKLTALAYPLLDPFERTTAEFVGFPAQPLDDNAGRTLAPEEPLRARDG